MNKVPCMILYWKEKVCDHKLVTYCFPVADQVNALYTTVHGTVKLVTAEHGTVYIPTTSLNYFSRCDVYENELERLIASDRIDTLRLREQTKEED